MAAPVWPAALSAAFAVGLGAALGALLRWQMAVWLNGLWPALPPGTLLANVLGGYLIGLALALFTHHPEWPATWRLFVVTGFLGGLTTFSTFSAEVVGMMHAGRWGAAGLAAGVHLAGSVVATLAGFWSVSAWRTPAG